MLVHSELVPDTHILVRGDFKQKGEKVEPGFLSRAGPGTADRASRPSVPFVPQRRKALALWLTSHDQPLLGARDGEPDLAGALRPRASSARRTTSDGRAKRRRIRNCSTGWPCEFTEQGWSMKQCTG